MDDSISVLAPDTVAVHVADPTSFIQLGSELDFNASLRSVTYYYPNKGGCEAWLRRSVSAVSLGSGDGLLA